jgi:hypothetical protein
MIINPDSRQYLTFDSADAFLGEYDIYKPRGIVRPCIVWIPNESDLAEKSEQWTFQTDGGAFFLA